jgi:hypothetical protein
MIGTLSPLKSPAQSRRSLFTLTKPSIMFTMTVLAPNFGRQATTSIRFRQQHGFSQLSFLMVSHITAIILQLTRQQLLVFLF